MAEHCLIQKEIYKKYVGNWNYRDHSLINRVITRIVLKNKVTRCDVLREAAIGLSDHDGASKINTENECK